MTASAALIEYAEKQILTLYKSVEWQRFDRWAKKREKPVANKIRSLFSQQQEEAIRNIEAGKSVAMKGPEQWLDQMKWQLIFEEFGQLFLPEVIGSKGQAELQRLIIGVNFDVTNPRVTAFVERYKFKFSFDTNKTTREALRTALTESLAAGEGIPGLTKRVNEVFEFSKKYRAERIARDQVIRASNFGAEQSYIQSRVVSEKEWLTADDDRLCPYCAPMNGKRVALGMTYFQQGDLLHNPDPESEAVLRLDYEDIHHPPLHPNCRCTLVPVLA
jgi:SPP1 gp7 family putative phage head morphogenesis protein